MGEKCDRKRKNLVNNPSQMADEIFHLHTVTVEPNDCVFNAAVTLTIQYSCDRAIRNAHWALQVRPSLQLYRGSALTLILDAYSMWWITRQRKLSFVRDD